MSLLRNAFENMLYIPVKRSMFKRLADFARGDHAYAQAIRWYGEAAELLPSLQGETDYDIASCYEEAGDIEQAMRWYRQIEQPSWHVRGQLALAKLLERQDRVDAAEAIYEQLANTQIPEAAIVRERLSALRAGVTHKE